MTELPNEGGNDGVRVIAAGDNRGIITPDVAHTPTLLPTELSKTALSHKIIFC